jgi:SAM-dependent methyltransferase
MLKRGVWRRLWNYVVGAHHPFLSPRMRRGCFHNFAYRRALLQRLIDARNQLRGHIIDVGSGAQPYRELVRSWPAVTAYTAVDLAASTYGKPDVPWDGQRLPFADGSIDGALLTEVLEHCADPEIVLREIYRVLQAGGSLFVSIPFFWPVHDAPNDFARLTSIGLENALRRAGFDDIAIAPLGGWEASVAQMLSLWAVCRARGAWRAQLLKLMLAPAVLILHAMDRPADGFANGTMAPGFTALARK